MKTWWSPALLAMTLPGVQVNAQVKDADGRALRAEEPAGAVRSLDGGRIEHGRPARCRVGEAPAKACTFFLRNDDGSFTIDVDQHAYNADKVATDAMIVEYFNGARMVPQGRYVRDRRDPACWRGRARGQRLCVDAAR